MKRKKRILKIVSAMFALAMVLTMAGSISAFAKEETFNDGVYIYQRTGYEITKWTAGTELVAKIDMYYFQNLGDEEFAGEDVYFYKRDEDGNRVSARVYGYAYTEFRTSKETYARTEPKYGYNNVEVEPEEGCSIWNRATPHYCANALRDY